MTQQIALQLNVNKDKRFANFYSKGNEALVEVLRKSAFGRGEQFIYFWGLKGLGRSHLLNACCAVAAQTKLTYLLLPLNEIEQLKPDVFEDLELLPFVCVDDLQNIAGNSIWEEAFFDFFNRMQEQHKRLIVSANVPQAHLNLELADLVSRLNSGLTFQLHELTDDEKMEAVVARSQERGLIVPPEVAKFLIHRLPRDLGSLFQSLDVLDDASLASQRRLTIPFSKEILHL